MRLTVAICTWNRAASLERALSSIATADPPRSASLEVLVVNNRCSDDTDVVIRRHLDRLPLRRLHEPEPGLSHARNAAVAAAEGDYLLWTDDDVVVDRQWLRGYEDAVREHPGAAFFGGPIEPVFDGGKPDWIARCWSRLSTAYAEREFGSTPARFATNRLPFGANMMVRMAEMRAHRFDTHLGRRPGRAGAPLVGGDETALFRRLLAAGCEGWWVPASRVRHCIPRDRQTIAYLRSYYEGQGVAEAFERPPAIGRTWFGRPVWLWRRTMHLELRYRWRRATRSPEAWLPALVDAARSAGRLAQARAYQKSLPRLT